MGFTESASTPLDVSSVKVEPFLYCLKKMVSPQVSRNGLHASF